MSLLDVRDLSVSFATTRGRLTAVEAVDLALDPGETLGIVGESGSGKSVAMLALMGLLPWTARVSAAALRFAGTDLSGLNARARRRVTGKDLAMVFQEPMTSLNPCFTIGFQIVEALAAHTDLDRRARCARAVALIERVGIPDAEARLRAFPHQLSGGMCQRAMIAMAIACDPKLLIADEPTTALDVTIQAQILELLRELSRERGMALVLISHDLGVIAEMADRVTVMYAGQAVESAPTETLLARPSHPYTAALLGALPERAVGRTRLPTIAGVVPGLADRPAGCLFQPRCGKAQPLCAVVRPVFDRAGRVRCHFPLGAA